MRNQIQVIRLATLVSLILCGVTFHGCDCSKKETLANCRTCTARYSYGSEAARQEACTAEEEQAFKQQWHSPQIVVECK